MVALQIRDVPEDVRQTLAEQASARGQSLQAYLLTLVVDEARRASNLAVLGWFVDRTDGSRLTVAESTRTLDKARAERVAQLSRSETEAR